MMTTTARAGALPAILGGDRLFKDDLEVTRPFLPDLDSVYPLLQEIFASGRMIKGKFVDLFEGAVADHLGVRDAVALSNCTAGLVLVPSLLGLKGEIVMPSFTFMASALSAAWSGMTPVFCDIRPDTWNLDPAAVEQAITPNTVAILATHVFGNPADIAALERIAEKHGLVLIFDAAHGFGSLYKGRTLGAYGRCEIFSCNITKLLICGDGGIVATNDGDLAGMLRSAREYGNAGNYDMVLLGINGRLPEMSAAVGLKSLEKLETAAVIRNQHVRELVALLSDLPGLSWQVVESGNRSSYKDLSCLVDPLEFGLDRDQLAAALKAEGILSRKYFHPPCHQQSFWQGRAKVGPGGLSNTEQISSGIISLPLSVAMTSTELELVAAAMRRLHINSVGVRRQLDASA